MANLLNEKIDFQIERTASGVWRRYLYANGARFSEYRSSHEFLGWPLVHYTYGINPETGKRVVAKGIVAVGRLAMGGIAIGHASLGLIAIGQLGVGLLFGLAQLATGYAALGQVALATEFGVGQVATGSTAIAQLGLGEYVLAQAGWGEHVWQQGSADPQAVNYFQNLWESVKAWW